MQRIKRISRGALAAIALSAGLAALPTAAQPGGHQHGEHFMQHLAAVKAQLNLNTLQQPMWDEAVAAGKAAREAAHARHATIRQVVAEEAAKPAAGAPNLSPNLERIAQTTDTVRDTDVKERRAVRRQWLDLYATFNADQAAVVKGIVAQRLSRMDAFRERMKQRFGKQ